MMEAIFASIQNDIISRILGVFSSGSFAKNWYNVHLDSFLICFWQFYILFQSDYLAKALAFAWRPFLSIFKMVSFLEY